MRPRSRWWWYRRFRRAYRNHDVTIETRRSTWRDARMAQRSVPVAEQRALRPLRRIK